MQDERRNRALSGLLLAGVSPFLFIACAGGTAMKAQYSRSSVDPVEAKRTSDSVLTLRYRIPPESNYYAKGVDYTIDGKAMKVYIVRCAMGYECNPMAAVETPAGDMWQAEVQLPYHGEMVVVVHADGEQLIYP